MSSLGLTDEQKRRIEENRRKALSLKAKKVNNGFNSQNNSVHIENSNIASDSKSTRTKFYQKADDFQEASQNNCHFPNFSSLPQKPFHHQSNPISNANTNRSFPVCQYQSQHSRFETNRKHPPSPSIVVPKEKFYGLHEKVIRGKCVLISKDRFNVDVNYHGPLIEYCKQMETRSYDTSSRTWSFQLREYDKFIQGVLNFQPDVVIEPLPSIIINTFCGDVTDDGIEEVNLLSVDSILVKTLLPFQKEGVYFALHHGGRVLLADEMGLGKTLQALCIASYYRREWPLLIVTPSSVRYDWAQQICKWLPSVDPQEVNVLVSGKGSVKDGRVCIISFDLMAKKIQELKQRQFKVVIMDESHFLKNSKAIRTKAAVVVSKLAKRIVLLSGTPALSRPSELFTQISAVCPGIFKFHDFGVRYCAGKQQPWGWDYSGSSNLEELQLIMEKKVMIRRQKSDVLQQLPDKTRQVILLNPVLISFNKDLKQAYKIMDKASSKGQIRRESLLQYFHETGKAKLKAVKDFILDLIESDKKFLVFAHHQEMLDCIEDAIVEHSNIKHIRIDGNTKSELRSQLCKKFQFQDEYRVAVLSIMAANAGLNLSAASLVIFAELFWNPGILVQAEDRVHRIGQKNSVLVQYLVAKKTADDFIWPLVQDKLNVLTKAGLTKDSFSNADTKHNLDKTQSTIMDIFKQNFLDDSTPTTSDDCQEEFALSLPDQTDASPCPVTPVKRKRQRSSSRSPVSKYNPTSSPETPRKRQLRITNFLQRSPRGSCRAVNNTEELSGKSSDDFETSKINKQLLPEKNMISNVQIMDNNIDRSEDDSLCQHLTSDADKDAPDSALLSQEDYEALQDLSWEEEFWN